MTELLDWLRSVTPDAVKQYYWAAWRIYSQPLFYGLIGVILVLEVIRPAVKEQRVFSRGLAQDFIWFNVDLAFKVAAFPAVLGLLHLAWDATTGGWRLTALDELSVGWRVLVSFLVVDFLGWFHHWVRHKVKLFWHFHTIHHSQRELNLFTDLRVHSAELIIARVLIFIPMLVFNVTPYLIMGVSMASAWFTRLIHANIRTNGGPLRHILVTPQYHRIHHSIEERHQDRNFGVVLTVWDRMFGTMYRNYDEYPATGLPNVDFPAPGTPSVTAWARNLGAQLIYPFKAVYSGLRSRSALPQDPAAAADRDGP